MRAKRYRLTLFKAVLFALLLAVSGLLGTKLLFVLENLDTVLKHGITLSGVSFYGALLLVPIMMLWIGRVFGLRFSESMDYCSAPVIFILICMRMGCMMNGCCAGIVINGFQIPAQLLEALGDSVIFTILWEREKKKTACGTLYPSLLIQYGIMRFFLEFIRDTDKFFTVFSQAQIYSVVAILIGYFWLSKKGRETQNGQYKT